jgi:uncharacterized protein
MVTTSLSPGFLKRIHFSLRASAEKLGAKEVPMRFFVVAALLLVSTARADWKRTIVDFAQKNLQHSAWGFGHSQRNLQLSLRLARAEGLQVDEDVLFAAAYLHDMGGFPAFEKKGVDHAVRSAELVGPLLAGAGFPADKVAKVKGTILAHTYYNPNAPKTPEETVFRDADVLDFLGAVGAARLLSVTARESFAPGLAESVAAFEKMQASLEEKLILSAAKREGYVRLAEAKDFLRRLKRETFGGRFY